MHYKKSLIALLIAVIGSYGCVLVVSCIARQAVPLDIFLDAAKMWFVFLAVGVFSSWWQLLVVDSLLILFTKINRVVLLALNYVYVFVSGTIVSVMAGA